MGILVTNGTLVEYVVEAIEIYITMLKRIFIKWHWKNCLDCIKVFQMYAVNVNKRGLFSLFYIVFIFLFKNFNTHTHRIVIKDRLYLPAAHYRSLNIVLYILKTVVTNA